MALVRDDCLIPTLDAPELGYVRESTSDLYVPDVFYKVCPALLTHRTMCVCYQVDHFMLISYSY